MATDELLSRDRLIEMYKTMFRIRRFEEKVNELFLQGILPGTVHQAVGQEAIAAGVCSALRRDDFISSTHRSHGHSIAKGLSLESGMAELFGKSTGCCRGKGGSMHLADYSAGMVPANAIVGEGIVIGTGLALAFRLKKTGQVAVSFFGDGAVNTGAFHEGVNMASVYRLPIVFVCENNLYAASTSFATTSPVANVSERASAYGIPGVTADGMNVRTAYATALEAVNRARNGEGPSLLEFKTYRYGGHSRSDPTKYRSREEVEYWKAQDPIARLRGELLAEGALDEAGVVRIENEIVQCLEDAVRQAQGDPVPEAGEVLNDVYA